MKKIFQPLIILGLILSFFNANAENILNSKDRLSVSDSLQPLKKFSHALFIEFLGHSIIGSVNYKLSFNLKNNIYLYWRLGALYFPYTNSPGFNPKKSYNSVLAIGYGKQNSFSSGIGISYFYGTTQCPDCYVPYHSEELFLTFTMVEYKLQKNQRGLFLSPSILYFIKLKQYDEYLRTHPGKGADAPEKFPFLGLSFGYTLKK
jgi:hypothetical protein